MTLQHKKLLVNVLLLLFFFKLMTWSISFFLLSKMEADLVKFQNFWSSFLVL